MRRIDVPNGEKYGLLSIIEEAPSCGKRKFRCLCECGYSVTVRLDHLRSGHTSSCGSCGVQHAGKRMSLKDWAAAHGIKESTLRARLKIMGMREALERK